MKWGSASLSFWTSNLRRSDPGDLESARPGFFHVDMPSSQFEFRAFKLDLVLRLRPPTTSFWVSNGEVGSSIESPRSLWVVDMCCLEEGTHLECLNCNQCESTS